MFKFSKQYRMTNKALPRLRYSIPKKILLKYISFPILRLCRNTKPLFLLTSLFLLCSNALLAQYLPPVSIYEPSVYKAGNQNWMIDQDKDGHIFFANNEGLLLFNGAQWQLFPSVDKSIIRSVKVVEDRVYTGHHMDFGYWTKKANGKYVFTSLVKKANIAIEEGEQFWGIVQSEQLILFQSLKRIYIYNPKFNKVNIIAPTNGIQEIFKAGNSIFYHSPGDGIYKLENENPVLFSQEKEIANASIIDIFSDEEGIKLLTKENGFFQFKNGSFEAWQIEAKAILETGDFFSAIQLKNGDLALGTISRGLIILNKKGQLKYQIDRSKSLNNNTVLSLKEDQFNNVWLGLDNGINCVNLASPYREYIDKQGILGTVYASIIFEDVLYIGTNQGLFWKSTKDNGEFNFIDNTNGQVWSLFIYDQALFCGHDHGTFLIKNNKANLIASQAGTWNFVSIPNHPDLLLQGNYDGLNILKKENAQWQFSHTIKGFNYSANNFVYHDNKIYINRLSKGLFKLSFDKAFKNILEINQIPVASPSKYSSLATLAGKLYYTSENGFYKLNLEKDQLERNDSLSNFLQKKGQLPSKLITDNRQKMWSFTKNDILFFSQNNNEASLKVNEIAVDRNLLKTMSGYENISALGDENFLFGLTNGYFYIKLNQLEKLDKDYEIFINSILMSSTLQRDSLVNLEEAGEFHYKENNINFSYSVPQTFKYQLVRFQFLLEGFQETWSDWSSENSIQFRNLKHGDYSFKVRAKVGNKYTKNITAYSFRINTPWYYSTIAILIYTLLGLAFAYLVNFFYKKHYHRQEEKLILKNQQEIEYLRLKNEKEMAQLKNEQLNAKMNDKNKELAATTMNLIKKNEFLISIRESLLSDDAQFQKKIEKVIKSINKELDNKESWELFKNAFDDVDKNFFKKIKEKHPQLSPNDIKLCTYLRLNLSSKEIAPLLNISVRSMEIKRYRLRKKMQLIHETNLVEYIMSI